MDLRQILGATARKRRERWLDWAETTAGEDAAEDVVQEALVRTLEAGPELANENKAHGYIWTVIARLASRPRRRRGPNLRETFRRTQGSALDELEAEEKAEAAEALFAIIRRTVDEMPDELRETVEMMVIRNPPMKLREVAELHGVAVSTVHGRLRKALRMIRGEVVKHQ